MCATECVGNFFHGCFCFFRNNENKKVQSNRDLHERQEVKTNLAQMVRSKNKICRNGNLSGRGIGAPTKNNGL
jgi:hypothetical protein